MNRRKKKGLARLQRFFKKHSLFFNFLLTLINVIALILPVIFGQEFIIIKTIHQINLNVTDAYAHASASIAISVSGTVTIQNASGIFINGIKSNNNSTGTYTHDLGTSDSVTMTVQNASGTYTFKGN
jgi:hypothetical protein